MDISSGDDFFKDIVEKAQTGIASHKSDGTIIYLNQYMADLMGYPRESIIGRSSLDFIEEEDRESVIRVQEELKYQRYKTINRRIRRKDGTVLWTRVNLIAQADDAGNLTGYTAIHTDITEQKKIEEALQESQLKAEMLIKYAPAGIYELDYTGPKFLSVNDAMCEITGYSREELLSMNPFLLLDEPGAENFIKRIHAILCGGTVPENVEYRIKVRDGRELWAALNVKIISNGTSSRALVIAYDVTGLKQLEEELKKHNETLEERVRLRSEEIIAERKRLYTVLETLPVYVILFDKDYHVRFANRFFREHFGESHDQRCYEYLFNRDTECEDCGTHKVMKTMAPSHWEWTGPDGRNYDIYDYPFFEADGSMLILEMGIDITWQKNAQDAMIKQQENLQKLNEELLKSNKELESFAFITSHDLQEPLRMVTCYTQLLAGKYKNQLDKDANEYIDFAVSGAKRMYDLINDLLNYSRISRKEITFAKVSINQVIETVKVNLHLTIKEKDCIIDHGNLPDVYADKSQMIHLFQNLIANGIKFSKKNPHINISAKTEASYHVFSVKDNGIGIESRYFDKIFEIFKRLNPLICLKEQELVWQSAGESLKIMGEESGLNPSLAKGLYFNLLFL